MPKKAWPEKRGYLYSGRPNNPETKPIESTTYRHENSRSDPEPWKPKRTKPRAITREIDFIADRGVKVNLEGNIMKKKTVQNNGKTTGQSGNPDGKPKKDIAAEIARKVLEQYSGRLKRGA